MTCTRFVLLLMITSFSSSALADEPRPAEILTAESERAMALAQEGQLDEAVAIWLDILDEVSPKGRADVHVNLAVAFKALDQLPEAWYHLDAALTQSAQQDPDVVAERAAIEKQLAKKHVPLRFSCGVSGTLLFLTLEKNRPYPCPLRWWFPRGTEDRIFAVASDHKTGDIPIRAHELDRDRRIVVNLEPAEKPVVRDDPADVPIVDKPPRAKGQAWKWSLFGGGMGLVATAAVLQVLAFNKDKQLRKDYPGDVTDYSAWQENRKNYQSMFNSDVKPLAYGAYALYGVGGAAAAAGLTFLISDWSRPNADSSIHIAPLMTPGFGGLTLDLGF